jgi:PKD repeat protein
MKITLILLLLILLTNRLFCQQTIERCGLDQYIQQLKKNHPNFNNEVQSLYIENVQNVKAIIQPKTTIILPIVVHVLQEGGNENISDAQIYSMISVLNQNFRKQNADTIDIITQFEGIAADANIEFRLAKIDPQGNYTNGIDRIYTHLTNNADMYSRINAWNTDKYINIWTCKSLDINGVAAFTTLPYDIQTPKCQVGISILHSYVGEIGTGNPTVARTIVHEMGHFLGLLHLNNDQPQLDQCGDDDLPDTPETKGYSSCPSQPNLATICNSGIIENYQNFMEFSYCQRMFSQDQVNLMHSVLQNPDLGRNQLATSSTLAETGIFLDPPPIGNPKAAFGSNYKFVCEGENVLFSDQSANALVNNRFWIFSDGTPSTSTSQNPLVSFSGLGWKQVKLIVSNDNGTDSIVEWQAVHVSQNWADKTGPFVEEFDTPNISWLVDNSGKNETSWNPISSNGISGSGCMKLNNFKDTLATPICSNEHYYNFQLGGDRDALISPSIDLSTSTNVNLSFQYAYTSSYNNIEDLTEVHKIYTSRNCGKTWVLKSTLSGLDLISSNVPSNSEFIPTTMQEWKNFSFPYISNPTDTRTRFKFEFNSSDYSNNFYFDNFQLTGVLNTTENQFTKMNFNVFPNPSSPENGITISYDANKEPILITVLDLQGKTIYEEKNENKNTAIEHLLKLPKSITSGMYYLKISQNNHQLTKKIIVN